MKSDTKIGIFVVLLLVAVVVVLLGREVMNRKKAATEPQVTEVTEPGTDTAYSEDGKPITPEGIKDEVADKPAPEMTSPLVFDPNATQVTTQVPTEPQHGLTPAPSPASLPPSSTPSEYEIKSGDSLERISKQVYGKRSLWHKLAEANPGINPNNLKVGTKLVVPPAPEARVAEASPVPSPAAGGRTYTIKKGDSFEKIAKQVFGKRSFASRIAEANPGVNPTRLQINMVIQLPEGPMAAPEAPRAGKTTQAEPWSEKGATRLVTSVATR